MFFVRNVCCLGGFCSGVCCIVFSVNFACKVLFGSCCFVVLDGCFLIGGNCLWLFFCGYCLVVFRFLLLL